MNDKPASKATAAKAGTPKADKSPADRPRPPRLVLYAAGSLLASGLLSVIAALTLFSGATDEPNGWYFKALKKSNDKLFGTASKHKKGYIEPGKLHDHVASAPKQLLLMGIVVLLALTVLGASTYRGKYWARWATLGLWILATITGTLAGIGSLLLITSSDINAVFKVPAFLSSLLFVVAVVLVNLRPSVEFFKLNKPERATAAAAPARRGLFAPRPAVARPSTPATVQNTEKTSLVKKTAPAPERPRSKARATSESAAKGAELARARAKASKSRRSGV